MPKLNYATIMEKLKWGLIEVSIKSGLITVPSSLPLINYPKIANKMVSVLFSPAAFSLVLHHLDGDHTGIRGTCLFFHALYWLTVPLPKILPHNERFINAISMSDHPAWPPYTATIGEVRKWLHYLRSGPLANYESRVDELEAAREAWMPWPSHSASEEEVDEWENRMLAQRPPEDDALGDQYHDLWVGYHQWVADCDIEEGKASGKYLHCHRCDHLMELDDTTASYKCSGLCGNVMSLPVVTECERCDCELEWSDLGRTLQSECDDVYCCSACQRWYDCDIYDVRFDPPSPFSDSDDK